MKNRSHECVGTSEARKLMKSIDEVLERATRFLDRVDDELHGAEWETRPRPYDADSAPVLAEAPIRMLVVAGLFVGTLGKAEAESSDALDRLVKTAQDDQRHPFDRLADVHRLLGEEVAALRQQAGLGEAAGLEN